MKYKNEKQRRKVSEFMDSLLLPLKVHLKEEEQELLDIGLRIIRNTEIENNEVNVESQTYINGIRNITRISIDEFKPKKK